LADRQTDLGNGRVILGQIRGVARQQKSPLVRFRVRQRAVEVVEGLQNIVRALDLRAGVCESGKLCVTDEADREDRAQSTEEGEAPQGATRHDHEPSVIGRARRYRALRKINLSRAARL